MKISKKIQYTIKYTMQLQLLRYFNLLEREIIIFGSESDFERDALTQN